MAVRRNFTGFGIGLPDKIQKSRGLECVKTGHGGIGTITSAAVSLDAISGVSGCLDKWEYISVTISKVVVIGLLKPLAH